MQERSGVVRIKRANGEVEETPVVVTQKTGEALDLRGRRAIEVEYDPSITLNAGDEILEMPGVTISLGNDGLTS